MTTFETHSHPHRRFNPLTGEWILVSPQRMLRPWQGQVETTSSQRLPAYDPDCYLCPGNSRAGGQVNPEYEGIFVFQNDFAALLRGAPESLGGSHSGEPEELLRAETVRGECRVICFSPRHDLTLARMTDAERLNVVRSWGEQTAELGKSWSWVQVFENRGEQMGASNPHPHGQIWALDTLPTIVAREDACQRNHYEKTDTPLLLAYAELERELGERLVAANELWVAVVPYWAVWPYEILLLPTFAVTRLDTLEPVQQGALAEILGKLLRAYDRLFDTPFPYSMGWHGEPFVPTSHGGNSGGSTGGSYWQLHAHFYPPLLRSASVRKFMVGFEMLGEAQRDLTPEQAAEGLRKAAGSEPMQADGQE